MFKYIKLWYTYDIMITLIDRLILYIAGCILTGFNDIKDMQMVYMLIGFILLCGSYYQNDLRKSIFEQCSYVLIAAISLIATGLIPFLPIIIYAYVYKYLEKKRIFYGILILFLGISLYGINESDTKYSSIHFLFIMISIVMAVKAKYIAKQKEEVKRLRDDSKEKNNRLLEKNKSLISNRGNEINIAILSERNRIAREIHDNVGHLLSRSILQVGAIMAVNKDETVKTLITPVRKTLDEAMNSIRQSVHDLHKESFDIENAAKRILEDLKEFDVSFDCDISMEADKEIKYTFLTILKEAVNNIEKYCDGDRVNVLMRELDEHYQMVVEDNGERIRKYGENVLSAFNSADSGIGLVNMQDRIRGMNGIIKFSFEEGFRIFISVPKNRE